MNNHKISIIAAIDEKRGLGKNNKLLWNIPEDLQRFKKITLGHPIIMGRKTFESIGRPLPHRTNIIVTRDLSFEIPDTIVVHSLKEGIDIARKVDNNCHPEFISGSNEMLNQVQHGSNSEVFIIGGGQIFKEAISLADKLYLTIVKGDFGADVFFPDYSKFNKKIFEQKGRSGEYEYTFLELERR